jgi:glyoxalase family protein
MAEPGGHMKLDGIHHITAITADAQQNVRFYAGVLGLRLVKKCVNQDDPTVYHLFYADEKGDPGSDITFFEYPGAPQGRAGTGMIHEIGWRVASQEALDFWERRLLDHEVVSARSDAGLRFSDPEGLNHELRVDVSGDEPLAADGHPHVPAEHALIGFDGVRAYTSDSSASDPTLRSVLGFSQAGDDSYTVEGERRSALYAYDPAPEQRGLQGGGSVHHIAWSAPMEDENAWRERVDEAGLRPTPVIDRYYFKSVYFREPSGVLFEIATQGPGFTVDEPLESLGEELSLPPDFEHLREKLVDILKPLPDPRAEPAQ